MQKNIKDPLDIQDLKEYEIMAYAYIMVTVWQVVI